MARHKKTIHVAIATTILSPYELGMVRGVIHYSEQVGGWRFFQSNNMPYAAFNDINLTQVDGVIGGFYTPLWASAVKQTNVIAVNTSNRYATLDLPRVAVDDVAVGRMAAEHLLGRGYPHYGFLRRDDNWYSDRRLEGFQSVIEREAGRVCHVYETPVGSAEDDDRPIPAWLGRLPKPMGIMAANDVRGRQLIDCAVAMGLRVPEDVGVVGVDNDEFASALAARSLSSVEIDGRETGFRAAQMLDALLKGEQPKSPLWTQPLGVVTRQSTDTTISQDAVVAEALAFIRDHCSEPIVVNDVLRVVQVSQTTLEVRMKRAIGKTPHVAISLARIERAKNLLISTTSSIGEIARDCGFARQERFNVVFKRTTGLTPGQFRQQRSR